MLPNWERSLEEDGPYDTEDPTFWIPHQTEDRMVAFNELTYTIDDIITQCNFPESARERLTRVHTSATRRYLQYYKGPLPTTVPVLQEEPQDLTTG